MRCNRWQRQAEPCKAVCLSTRHLKRIQKVIYDIYENVIILYEHE